VGNYVTAGVGNYVTDNPSNLGKYVTADTQYQHAEIVQMPGSDHMVFSGASLSITMGHIDDWLIKNQLTSAAPN
jgi:hypothetical protein